MSGNFRFDFSVPAKTCGDDRVAQAAIGLGKAGQHPGLARGRECLVEALMAVKYELQ